jgi:hypothetical protein
MKAHIDSRTNKKQNKTNKKQKTKNKNKKTKTRKRQVNGTLRLSESGLSRCSESTRTGTF